MKGIYFLLMIFLLGSCAIPSAKTVSFSYLDIEEMTLTNEKSDFRDAWLFIDGQSNGVYELPRRIPIVSEEAVNITIQAGIRENGVSSSPRVYPFVDNYELSLDLEDGEEMVVEPVFTYLSNIELRLNANFEGENFFGFDEDGVDSIELSIEAGEGVIALDGGEILEEATKFVYSDLPTDGTPVYLEIEYKGNLDLDVGLIGVSGSEVFKDYFVSLRSENDWKKAYINFTELILASQLDGYQVLIGADNSGNSSEALIYVDNIKLLHF